MGVDNLVCTSAQKRGTLRSCVSMFQCKAISLTTALFMVSTIVFCVRITKAQVLYHKHYICLTRIIRFLK